MHAAHTPVRHSTALRDYESFTELDDQVASTTVDVVFDFVSNVQHQLPLIDTHDLLGVGLGIAINGGRSIADRK